MARLLQACIFSAIVLLASGKPASYKENLIDSDLNRTVEEVVNILGQRPDLPRLTKGEILELVTDVRRQKSLSEEKKKQEPLVVVMPFRPNGTSIEELYTQAPVTQVIGDLATKLASKRPGHKRRRKPIPRPVYIHTEATTLSTTPITPVPSNSPVDTVSIIQKIPARTTNQPITTETSWKPLEELVIPDDMKDAIIEITVKPPTTKTPITTQGTKKPTVRPVVPPEDVSVAAESLSDEMKDLLATFGLLGHNTENEKPVPSTPKDQYSSFEFGAVKPKVDPNSYISFKPLPDNGDDTMTPDMKDFLASFGLINERSGRNMKPEVTSKQKRSKEREDRTLKEVPKINSEMFSDDMMTVLENLGIANSDNNRKAKRLGEHIFNPAQRTAELNRTDQIEKVQKLVTKIKELSANHEIHTLTPSELRDLLKTEADLIQLGSDGNLLIKTDTLDSSGGPDPLSLDEIVELLDKNESKRQGSSENVSTEKNPTISTRRYDIGESLNSEESEEEEDSSTEESADDFTPEQSTNIVVTTLPDESSSNMDVSSTTQASESSSNDSTTLTATESPAAPTDEERASSSSSSSANSSSSASASASSTSGGESSSASSSDSSSSSASASSEADSQPMAAEGPSFDDLNESFGGEITTTPRPNGLFFLLDWNSFLQVGTDERKVDLTFNPKIGDPKNFYPIRFP